MKRMKKHTKVILFATCAVAAAFISYGLFTNSLITLVYVGLTFFVGSCLWVGIEYNIENSKSNNKQVDLNDIPDEVKCKSISCERSFVKQDVYVVPYNKIGYTSASTLEQNTEMKRTVKVRKRTINDF